MKKKVLNIDKSSWKLTKLGDLLEDISQRVDNPSQSGYNRFVGLEHFVSGDIKIKNWGTTENLTSSTKAFKSGDILFARRNAYLRRASLVDFDGCCSGDAFVLRENHKKVVPGFMAFFFNSNAVWDFANQNAAGTMSQRVKWRDLANYEFLLPPKDQQAQLAELLWEMDEVIEREREVLEMTSLARKSYEDYMLFGKFLTSKFKSTKIGEFPESWKLEELQNIAWFQEGPGLRKWQFKDDGIKVINVTNLVNGFLELSNTTRHISWEEFNSTYKHFECEVGDIVIASSGNSYCKHAVIREQDLPLVMNTSVIRFQPLKGIDYDFLNQLLKSRLFKSQIDILITGGAQPNFGPMHLKQVVFPVPSEIETQKMIGSKLTRLDQEISNIETKIQTSQSLQKSLINQIF